MDILINRYGNIAPASLDKERIDRDEYFHMVGKLIYIIIYTRPDIAFTLGRLS